VVFCGIWIGLLILYIFVGFGIALWCARHYYDRDCPLDKYIDAMLYPGAMLGFDELFSFFSSALFVTLLLQVVVRVLWKLIAEIIHSTLS